MAKAHVLERLKHFFEERIPFNRFLGMVVDEIGDGHVILSLPFREELIGDPEVPALHGGVISSLLDTAGGIAVWSQLEVAGRVSTVDLRVDYLRPGRSERLLGVARVVRQGNRVGVVELRAYHAGAEDKPIAVGMGVYNIRRGSKRKAPSSPAGS